MIGRIMYFDVCAVPIFIIIIVTTFYRGMTVGRSNRLYLAVAILAFSADLCELFERLAFMGYTMNMGFVSWVKISEYFYYMTRNAVNVVYLFFVISMTKTWYKISAMWKKVLLILPYAGILGMLMINEFTGWVFTVTQEEGYQRGAYVTAVYGLAACYLVIGVTYLIVHRHTLDRTAWFSLMAMYLINVGCVLVQYYYPNYLIESFATSLTILFVVLYVQRPEKLVDMTTGLPAYSAFCGEMEKIKATGHNAQIIIVSLRNGAEMGKYLRESYYTYLQTINDQIRACSRREKEPCEVYFEQPGNFYIVLDNEKYNPVQVIPEIRELIGKNGIPIIEAGAHPDTRIVTVTFPKEIESIDELLRFGHNFARFADYSRIFNRASAITSKREYQIEAHLDEILNRAIASNTLNILYQPIWSVSENRFASAEAVIAITDEKYGSIDPAILTDAAEERGLSITLGSRVVEEVFAFAGSEAFRKLGLSRILIALSVTQCMRMDLTDTIWNLREMYRVSPAHIAFAIKESSYENMSRVFNLNLKKLSAQGYTIVLDSFGHGYSNVQHLIEMPINAVTIDRSIVSTAGTRGGRAILGGMIEMVKKIPLEVIARGADDKETADMLREMGCDHIQGHFYADPSDKESL